MKNLYQMRDCLIRIFDEGDSLRGMKLLCKLTIWNMSQKILVMS
jgi:hypothetical protein